MNLHLRLANLIQFILTYVQTSLFCSLVIAAPNLLPPPKSPGKDLPVNVGDKSLEMDALSISEATSHSKNYEPSLIDAYLRRRFSLTAAFYTGPHLEDNTKIIYLTGIDYQYPLDPSRKWHGGFSISNSPNPLIYFSDEFFFRKGWPLLKSWNYTVQLEVDSAQGLGALYSLNHYMAGVGASLELLDSLDLDMNVYFLTLRGISGEVKLRWLVF